MKKLFCLLVLFMCRPAGADLIGGSGGGNFVNNGTSQQTGASLNVQYGITGGSVTVQGLASVDSIVHSIITGGGAPDGANVTFYDGTIANVAGRIDFQSTGVNTAGDEFMFYTSRNGAALSSKPALTLTGTPGSNLEVSLGCLNCTTNAVPAGYWDVEAINPGSAVTKPLLWVRSTTNNTGDLADFTASGGGQVFAIRNTGEACFAAIAAPAAVSGNMWNDSTQQSITVNEAGIQQTLDGTIWTMVLSSSIFNVATEMVIVSSSVSQGSGGLTGVGTTLLPANFFTAGKTIYGVLIGTYTTTGTPTLDIKVKLGATTILDTGIVTQVAVTGTDVFTINFMITCRTTGASGTVIASGQTVQNTNTIGTTGMDLNSTVSTISTTAAQHLTVTVAWGTASTSNNLTLTNGFLTVKN